MKDKFSEWLQKIQRVHPKADEEVLQFIYDFSVKQGYGETEEVLYQQFANGLLLYLVLQSFSPPHSCPYWSVRTQPVFC